jgi:hypothetical protein
MHRKLGSERGKATYMMGQRRKRHTPTATALSFRKLRMQR